MFILYLFAGYLFLVWLVIRLIVPHMGFSKSSLPKDIPIDVENKIEELKSLSSNKQEFLEKSYDYVNSQYNGGRTLTLLKFWRAFGNVFNKKPGFLQCNMQNQLLRIILVESGYFSDEDIQLKVVPLNFFIHQYLKVKMENGYIDVDPWSNFLGLKLGQKSFLVG